MMVDIRNILLCSLVGLPFGLFFAVGFYCNTIRKGIIKFLISIGIIFATSFLIGFLIYCEAKANHDGWNGGLCPNCQTEWRFSGASHDRNITYYYYVCDNCGKIIETTQNFN